jgi:hypothetical protein
MMIPRESQSEYLDVAEAIDGRALGTVKEPEIFALEDLMLDNVYAAEQLRGN